MQCSICPNDIPPERLAIQPRVKTCSSACSAELTRLNNLKAQKRFRERKKEAKR